MGEAARRDENVVDAAEYIRGAIGEIDDVMSLLLGRRESLAIKLAVIDAADDPAIRAAADDYLHRVAEGRPYEDARPAEDVIAEAMRRFGDS